ncbi:MAG: protein kinase, partial [bacterium]|nr:protein kinase [bacterium]
YMSPEQVRGEETDHRTDIWSLGVVVYEMVTGRLPFRGESAQTVAPAILNDQPEPITAQRAGVPMELEWIVAKALAKKPEERYQHVEEAAVDLRGLGRKMEAGTTATVVSRRAAPVASDKPVRPSRREHIAWALAAVATIAFSALAIVHFRETTAQAPLRRFAYSPATGVETTNSNVTVAISPNGKHVAYVA